MRTALLFQDGNFVGREYFAALSAQSVAPDIVVPVGRMKPESIDIERERTGNGWNPSAIPESAIHRRFDRLDDPKLIEVLVSAEIDVAIQGGVGILKDRILAAPRVGWLNIHPGKLPQYRGNSCPEWAVLNGDAVFATAHFIDEGIDTGPVIGEAEYGIAPGWSYFDFRANLYRHCAALLVSVVRELAAAGADAKRMARPQANHGARYWPPLDAAQRAAVRARFPIAA
jgi:methionyl-tRNA formyltransferase